MKILSWVHRAFSNKGEKAMKNNGINAGGHEKTHDDQLHEVENISNKYNVFDHHLWSAGGILTIGTFGYDPLIKDRDHVSSFYEDEDKECRYAENEQLSASAAAAAAAVVEYDQAITDDVFEEQVANPLVSAANYNNADDAALTEGNRNCKNYFCKRREFDYVMMEKRERTTLADLFSAGPDDEKLQQPVNVDVNINVINKSGGVRIRDKAKCCKEKKSRIRKLNQMMQRVLRRKIHPDLNSKVSMKKWESNDNASLLPTEDVTI